MREFNTFGPINPKLHYHVNRIWVKVALREKVEKGRYLTLNASRQTGKTTTFRELIAELEAEGQTVGILLNFEPLAAFKKSEFYKQLGKQLEEWRERKAPDLPSAQTIRHQADFVDWLRQAVRQLGKRCVLIIDEFDAIPIPMAVPILAQFRAMYLLRDDPQANIVHSILLVGVRTVPSLLGGTQSPFNIADQFTIPYFTDEEVQELVAQYTAESGQRFEPEVFKGIMAESEGQPFLVNRLCQILTQEINPNLQEAIQESITVAHFEMALRRLVNENNTHFASIRSKAALHRVEVLNAIFNPARYYDFQDEVTVELVMYGVLRVLRDEQGSEYARIANPIYRKMLVKAFAPTHAIIRQAANGGNQHLYLIEGLLHFDKLLDHFKAFMEEHGVRLLKSEKTQRPLEISGQYLLLSYLTAALQSIGGYITVESVSSAGEIDILSFYRGNRFMVETKIWYNQTKFDEGKQQLVDYLQAAGLSKGYLIVFDEKLSDNPVVKEKGAVYEIVIGEKTVRVYLIGIAV